MQKQNTKNIKFKLPVHVKTLIFSALLVLISLISHSQYKLLNSPQHSAHTYIYQITDLQAFEFIYGENEKVDSTLFSNCIDTLSFNEAFKPIKLSVSIQLENNVESTFSFSP